MGKRSEREGCAKWHLVLGAITWGGLAYSVTVCAQRPGQGSGTSAVKGVRITAGVRLPGDSQLPVLPPVEAARHGSDTVEVRSGEGAVPLGADNPLYVTAGAFPVGACCEGISCQWLNELECAETGGYWLSDAVTCGSQFDCALPDSDSPCCAGSCCTGGGRCVDDVLGLPMTELDCMSEGGVYIGGPLCDDEPLPCPVCEIADDNNCQQPVLGPFGVDFAAMSDRSLLPNGPLAADDFIPQGDMIYTICAWGVYMDSLECLIDGNPECECIEDVTDRFLVRVYADSDDLPGALVGWSTVAPGNVVQGVVEHGIYGCTACTIESRLREFHLPLDFPIAALVPGQRYWLEVSNNTTESQDCNWHWLHTTNVTNNYSVHGINPSPGSIDFTEAPGRYARGSERGLDQGSDLTFCLNMNLADPPVVSGSCCDCSGTSCIPRELAACALSERWEDANDCSGGCVVTGPPLGDTCTDMDIVVVDQQTFTYDFDTTCSNTDGPDSETGETGQFNIGSDIWVHYVAPIAGLFYVHMCATGERNSTYDSALAVYRDSTDSMNCVCPGDDGFQVVDTSDAGCSGIGDGGGGKLAEPIVVAAGDCVTVRPAGFNAEFGRGTVHMGVLEVICTFTSPPLPDPRVADIGFGTRNRYLSFGTGSTGVNEAMRVTFASLPPPYNGFNGDEWFVGQPVEVTEASGNNGSTPPPTFWAATLQCGLPHFDDWAQYGVVHVYDAGIIGGASYVIQAVAHDCNLSESDSYSSPLMITTSVFGDIAGDCGTQPCSPPQGVIDFVDISGCVEKFRNLPAALDKGRADVINSDVTSPTPDRKVDFVDIAAIVDAFRGAAVLLPGPQTHCP